MRTFPWSSKRTVGAASCRPRYPLRSVSHLNRAGKPRPHADIFLIIETYCRGGVMPPTLSLPRRGTFESGGVTTPLRGQFAIVETHCREGPA